jgi:uncharacterized heparinase superfamily protein
LKFIQVAYQFKYRIFKPKPLKYFENTIGIPKSLRFFKILSVSPVLRYSKNTYVFWFLNLEKKFENKIDWNFQNYGKLWNYNLQYLDFLKQESITDVIKISLVKDLYGDLWEGNLLLEPYPASLRIMNMIRFLSNMKSHDSESEELMKYLSAEVNYLSKNLEYHILANHLMENAFALLMGGYFFDQKEWKDLGEKILLKELNEQILNDGAHFELSPMYHQIILFRVLEALAYIPKENGLYNLLFSKAGKMLSWLKSITFSNGSIPHFNDSTDGISYTTSQLLKIADSLEVQEMQCHEFSDSGFRKYENEKFELIIDFHGISPSYQPGHAHADTFSYCMNYKNKPIVVDTGISTYNISPRRDYERGTKGHNTIAINSFNSAEVWAGFRIGKRLKVKILKDENEEKVAEHDGYRDFGVIVQRQVKFFKADFTILDKLKLKKNRKIEVKNYIHFHPLVKITELTENVFLVNDELKIQIEGVNKVIVENYDYCSGFNNYQKAKRMVINMIQEPYESSITFKS